MVSICQRNPYVPIEHYKTLKHIYLSVCFSKGLIRDGTIEAEQKYNAVSNKAEEVKNKVNERFNKAP